MAELGHNAGGISHPLEGSGRTTAKKTDGIGSVSVTNAVNGTNRGPASVPESEVT